MSLPDRIDPRPAKRIYRWDLDKTYLKTEFDTFRQLVRTVFQGAKEKVAVPGAAALIRELKASGDSRVCFVSGSPTQMREVLEQKLKLDGVQWDEFVLKDNVGNLLRGRLRALRGQVGYKLPVLLESRAGVPPETEEVLFGDDAESDAWIYSLYADVLAGRVGPDELDALLEAANVYDDDQARVRAALARIRKGDIVRRIFIHLDRLTPPGFFTPYGPRLVPVFNYFQAALVLMGDGLLSAPQVLQVAADMIQTGAQNLLTLSNSFQDLLRRGLPLQPLAASLAQALEGPQAALAAIRPVPDILTAFAKRIRALGAAPPPPTVKAVDYRRLLERRRQVQDDE